MELAFANIFSYLAGAYAAGGCFADYLDKVHDNNPSSFNNPWSCILYVDELHPGNQLAGNSRNTWAIYCSSAQFGATLSNSESWLTVLGERSKQVSQLAASIGQCFRLILEHTFDNKYAHPHSGVLLQGGPKRLKLSVGYCNRPRWARMQERSTACNKTEFRRWSQASGVDYSQHSLLLSDKLKSQNLLRPITQYMHDYMHGLCPNGVLNWVFFFVDPTACFQWCG